MAARHLIETFWSLLRNRLTEFNDPKIEVRSQRPLPCICVWQRITDECSLPEMPYGPYC